MNLAYLWQPFGFRRPFVLHCGLLLQCRGLFVPCVVHVDSAQDVRCALHSLLWL
jgi:hypothetical protein